MIAAVWFLILSGLSAAMLGISGFESSANFVEEQAPGVFIRGRLAGCFGGNRCYLSSKWSGTDFVCRGYRIGAADGIRPMFTSAFIKKAT